jgi:hypothetical protein
MPKRDGRKEERTDGREGKGGTKRGYRKGKRPSHTTEVEVKEGRK